MENHNRLYRSLQDKSFPMKVGSAKPISNPYRLGSGLWGERIYFFMWLFGKSVMRGRGLFFHVTFRKSVISGLSRTTGIFVVQVLGCSSLSYSLCCFWLLFSSLHFNLLAKKGWVNKVKFRILQLPSFQAAEINSVLGHGFTLAVGNLTVE